VLAQVKQLASQAARRSLSAKFERKTGSLAISVWGVVEVWLAGRWSSPLWREWRLEWSSSAYLLSFWKLSCSYSIIQIKTALI
jgi:hypothetical protein